MLQLLLILNSNWACATGTSVGAAAKEPNKCSLKVIITYQQQESVGIPIQALSEYTT